MGAELRARILECGREISGRNKSIVNVQLHQRELINKGYSDIGSKKMHFHSRETPLAVVSVYSEDSFPRLGNSNVYIDIDSWIII